VRGRFNFPLLMLLTLIPVSILIYEASNRVEEYVQRRVISDMVSVVGHTIDNMANEILEEVGDQDIVLTLFHDDNLRRRIEDSLSLLITPEIKYVYIVYRDEEGKFRFIADGSKEDRAEPGEKLDVFELKKWNEAVESGRSVIIIQENLYTIGATYIRPIKQKGSVRALLAADFSINKIREVKGTLGMIKYLSTATSAVSLFFISLALYQYMRKRRLEKILFTDRLTGLFNRSYLEAQSLRIDPGDSYLALIDADDFRKVNTTYGEDVGDKVITGLARLLKERLPEGSMLIRYSGEEFLILVPKRFFKGKPEAIKFFESLRKHIKNAILKIDGNEVKVTISIGLNLSTERSRSLSEAIRGADRALYRAKREGKDRVEAYDESVEELRKRLSVDEVRSALDFGRVICHYQPVVDIKTGKISHYEALARIVGQNGEVITPAYFLEDIKDTFLYTRFTKEIIKINAQLLEDRENLRISINLIPTDLMDQGIYDSLRSLKESVRRRMLLEITEVEGIPSFERFKKAIAPLRRLGFKICIDDFGAGYSNLINLTQLRIDYLKIDGSIIRDIHRNSISYLLTKKVTEFCRAVNIEVIAEYVENEEVVKKLREAGIRYGQGFYLGKPRSL